MVSLTEIGAEIPELVVHQRRVCDDVLYIPHLLLLILIQTDSRRTVPDTGYLNNRP